MLGLCDVLLTKKHQSDPQNAYEWFPSVLLFVDIKLAKKENRSTADRSKVVVFMLIILRIILGQIIAIDFLLWKTDIYHHSYPSETSMKIIENMIRCTDPVHVCFFLFAFPLTLFLCHSDRRILCFKTDSSASCKLSY